MNHYGIELTRATEAVAIEASRHTGLGDEKALASAATRRMLSVLGYLELGGTIAVGDSDGPLADAVELPGKNPSVSLAIKAVEGLSATSLGGRNAISLLAVSVDERFPTIPSMYMDKTVVQPWAAGVVDLDVPVSDLLTSLAKIKKVSPRELRAVVLDRPRNQKVIEEIRSLGTRVNLIADGDVAVSFGILTGRSGSDVMLGSGGAREAVFTAAAARAVGDLFMGRWLIRTGEDEKALRAAGISPEKFRHTLLPADLAPGDVSVSATAITENAVLPGVRFDPMRVHTYSILLRAESGTIRFIQTSHLLRHNQPVSLS